jgi:hypothetical protein
MLAQRRTSVEENARERTKVAAVVLSIHPAHAKAKR